MLTTAADALRLFPGTVLHVGGDGVVLGSNGRAEARLAREVVGRPLAELLEESSRQKARAAIAGVAHEPQRLELAFDEGDTYRLRTFLGVRADDGGGLWLFEQVCELGDFAALDEIAALNADLSEAQRQLGRERARLTRALAAEAEARAVADVSRRTVALLGAISEAALEGVDLDALFREVLARLREGLQVDVAAVLLLDDDARMLSLRASQGLPEAVWAQQIAVGQGLAGRVAASRQAIAVPDLKEAAFVNAVAREHLGSLAGAPMIAGDRLIGVLSVATAAPHPYSDDQVALLKAAAGRIAAAVERHRLWAAERDARAEAQAAVKQRDEVLSIVAHDLRNPLGRILMSLSLLKAEFPAGAAPRTLAIMERAVKTAERLVRDLLDVGRMEAGRLPLERAPVNAAELLSEIGEEFSELAASRRVTLRVAPAEGLPPVNADRARLRQALANLLDNALRLTPAAGTVALEAAPAQALVEFRVKDTGPGIPADQIPHLFDRFWQGSREHRGSSGLGLAIVKGVVDAHGGRVFVESREGEGTAFRIWMPRA